MNNNDQNNFNQNDFLGGVSVGLNIGVFLCLILHIVLRIVTANPC